MKSGDSVLTPVDNGDSGSPITRWLVAGVLVPVTALTGVAALRRKR